MTHQPSLDELSLGSSSDPWLGSIVGERYRVDARIGQGGMGVVYSGQHLELGRRVAIKRLESRIAKDAESFARFKNEAIAASRITSPHVVQVFDWGKAADGAPFLVMELLEGTDLRALFQREGRLTTELCVALVVQILQALVSIHQAQIVHRDLKPENIFLCSDGSAQPFVKLLDFGISKRTTPDSAEGRLTRDGAIVGTAAYMSPEQACGDLQVDERSDLYSVGVILYEALTGQVPHAARTYEATLVQICTRDADDVRLLAPLVPEPLAKIVTLALKRDRNERYATAKQFYDAMVDAMGLSARPSTPPLLTREAETVTRLSATETAHMPDRLRAPQNAEVTSVGRRLGPYRWALLLALTCVVVVAVSIVLSHREPPPASSGLDANSATIGPAALSTATLDPATNSEASVPQQAVTATPTDANAGTRQRATLEAGRGGSLGRNPTPRPGTAPRQPSAPPESPGVASGLKLRRTMQ